MGRRRIPSAQSSWRLERPYGCDALRKYRTVPEKLPVQQFEPTNKCSRFRRTHAAIQIPASSSCSLPTKPLSLLPPPLLFFCPTPPRCWERESPFFPIISYFIFFIPNSTLTFPAFLLLGLRKPCSFFFIIRDQLGTWETFWNIFHIAELHALRCVFFA